MMCYRVSSHWEIANASAMCQVSNVSSVWDVTIDSKHKKTSFIVKRPVAISVKMTLFSRIELFPAMVLSSRDPNCSNNIWLFYQQFEWLWVNGDSNSHLQVLGSRQPVRWHFTSSDLSLTLSHAIIILFNSNVSIVLLRAISSFLFYCCICI